jgi:hypothetical protein
MTDRALLSFAFRERRSVPDLVEDLGEVVARLPVEALPRDRPSFGCSFRDIPPAPYVDMSAVERLEGIAADGRAEMGEDRWRQLQADWNNPTFEVKS